MENDDLQVIYDSNVNSLYKYISTRVDGPILTKEDYKDYLEGCQCIICDDYCLCGNIYEKNGTLKLSKIFNYPDSQVLRECNCFCLCGPQCSNFQSLQNGIQKKLLVQHTQTEKGFGVYALEDIKKCEFVCEYTGELITEEERIIRQNNYKIELHKHNYILSIYEHIFQEPILTNSLDNYDTVGISISSHALENSMLTNITDISTSLKPIDIMKQTNTIEKIPISNTLFNSMAINTLDISTPSKILYNFTHNITIPSNELKTICTHVDATYSGNVARFMNHSCDPNLVIVPIRINTTYPHAALFAIRDISKGEELVYDYGGNRADIECDLNTKVLKFNGYKVGSKVGLGGMGKECFCFSLNCRSSMPFWED